MKQITLLKLPQGFTSWHVFEGTPFGDNGGEPDGSLWLQDIRYFDANETNAAVAAGAEVVRGWQVDYVASRDSDPHYGKAYCGYASARVAYTLSQFDAASIERHARIADQA